MLDLLIIADDFTGALDTGVQLAGNGTKTKVTTAQVIRPAWRQETEVLVIDAETRHLPAEEAAAIVRDIVTQAVALEIPHIYKKTDSALRGNIGAELEAMLDASGEKRLAFLPAFPQIGRCTVDGIHYIGGTPVEKSVFGIDPFEPVRHSQIGELIAEQSKVPVHSVLAGGNMSSADGIHVFDASCQEHLKQAGQALQSANMLRICAGCAGFAAVLTDLLGMEKRPCTHPALDPRLLVICGSVNPITCEQVAVAEQHGFAHWRLAPEQKLTAGYWQSAEGQQTLNELRRMLADNPFMVIDSNDVSSNAATAQYAAERGMTIDDIRTGISHALGQIVGELFTSPDLGTLLITGGDTLLQCMQQMGVTEMEPVCEVYPGVVLSRFSYGGCSRYVISKSGGFGEKTLLPDLKNSLLLYTKKEAS